MTREVPRTLHTLSKQYQEEIKGDYEVIVVENGSSERLCEEDVCSLGAEFRYVFYDEGNPSPVPAMNFAASQARGDILCFMNDGARMLSPGIVAMAELTYRAIPNAVVTPLSWHLGPDVQMKSIQDGYCQSVEDALLETIPWRTQGYSLFTVSALAGSSAKGWFGPLAESNCLFMTKEAYAQVGGLDERFASPGGGLIALDFFKNAWLLDSVEPVIMLGEGTFHQVHGGIATNAPADAKEKRLKVMHDEYESIRGCKYQAPERSPFYMGKLPKESRPFLRVD